MPKEFRTPGSEWASKPPFMCIFTFFFPCTFFSVVSNLKPSILDPWAKPVKINSFWFMCLLVLINHRWKDCASVYINKRERCLVGGKEKVVNWARNNVILLFNTVKADKKQNARAHFHLVLVCLNLLNGAFSSIVHPGVKTLRQHFNFCHRALLSDIFLITASFSLQTH